MRFVREPAAWAALAVALVSALATWKGNPLVTDEQLPLVVAVVDALAAAVVAARVRPIAPSVVTGVISAVGALLAGYGVTIIPHDFIGVVNAVLVPAVLGLIARDQQTPKVDPAATAPERGPVR